MTWWLFLRNVGSLRRLLLVLISAMTGFAAFLVQISAVLEEGPGLAGMLEMLPPIFQDFMGTSVANLSFASFIAFGFQHPGILAMAISFVVLAGSIPAAEVENRLADLLLAKRVNRSEYVWAALATIVLGALVLPAAQLAGAGIGLAFVDVEDAPSLARFVSPAAGQIPLLLCIGCLALFFASGARRRGSAVSPTLAIVLVSFIVEAFATFYAPLQSVQWLSMFHYYRPIDIVMMGADWTDAARLVAVAAVLVVLAHVRFSRRDL